MGDFFGFFVFLGGGGGLFFDDRLERELGTKEGEVQGIPS